MAWDDNLGSWTPELDKDDTEKPRPKPLPMRLYILDSLRRPVTVTSHGEWAKWLETHKRTVALDVLEDGRVVSTVFLAMDHNWGDSKVPVLWETMIFPSETNYINTYVERYTSEVNALVRHVEIVEMCRRGEFTSQQDEE